MTDHPAAAAAAARINMSRDSNAHDTEGAGRDYESCKNTPFVGRKFDAHHRTFRLHNGCGTQSAQSSPLPHRRLDKLEGVIRDKPTASSNGIRFPDAVENSPLLVSSKFFTDQPPTCNCPPGTSSSSASASGGSGVFCTPIMSRRNAPHPCQTDVTHLSTPLRYRRRVESDASRQATSSSGPGLLLVGNNMTKSDYSASDMSLMPLRRTMDFLSHNNGSGGGGGGSASPVRGVLGEPGVFASPARSIAHLVGGQGNCRKVEKEQETGVLGPSIMTTNGEADQSIVSGWLKFRDNKRVRVVIEGCKFNFPQSTSVLMSFQFNSQLLRSVGLWLSNTYSTARHSTTSSRVPRLPRSSLRPSSVPSPPVQLIQQIYLTYCVGRTVDGPFFRPPQCPLLFSLSPSRLLGSCNLSHSIGPDK